MTVWIGWLQWIKFNGFGSPQDPILRRMSENFQCRDSILVLSDPAKPMEPLWPRVDFIVGNPPFLGGNHIRKELGDAYVETLFRQYTGRVPAFADLCCYWFEKARSHIQNGGCKRAGLLATQGIRGGANREVLKKIKQTGDIFWAISDKDWVLDGANVHVSLIAFDDGAEEGRTLDGHSVQTINPDLSSAADITRAQVLRENQGISFQGLRQRRHLIYLMRLPGRCWPQLGIPMAGQTPMSCVLSPARLILFEDRVVIGRLISIFFQWKWRRSMKRLSSM